MNKAVKLPNKKGIMFSKQCFQASKMNWLVQAKFSSIFSQTRLVYLPSNKEFLDIADGKQQSLAIQSLQPASTDNSSYQILDNVKNL